MRVLGIESSCDETGVAIYDSEHGLIAQALHSQIVLHQQYGGVVPELASRDHIKQLIPLVDKVLLEAKLEKSELDAIAYTAGPGLIGALLTGASFAKSLAYALQIPALAVNHLEAHLLAAQIDLPRLVFPFLALLVSGGHTQLIYANKLGDYQLLGDTLDDAVGEAFDKTAKLMGISYPGGAKLAQLADGFIQNLQKKLPAFPRPMTDRPGLDFSFSGLKTHALTTWSKSDKTLNDCEAIAFAFQQAVIETLLIKCQRALASSGANRLVVAGGVGANHALRTALKEMMQRHRGEVFFPRHEYCTDNGAMVAFTGFLHFNNNRQDENLAIVVKARWPLV
jgi:N6-L-threonylcarbamoyladenine synthase